MENLGDRRQHEKWPAHERLTKVPGHEALCLELLDGNLGSVGEQEHIPVLVAHGVQITVTPV